MTSSGLTTEAPAMCANCGDLTKPACDVDPDCEYHCYGGEHSCIGPVFEHDFYWAGRYLEIVDLGEERRRLAEEGCAAATLDPSWPDRTFALFSGIP